MKFDKEHIVGHSVISKRPLISGVYFLINTNDEIVYVGSAEDVIGRIGMHVKDINKKFSRHFIIEMPDSKKSERISLEREYITEHCPVYNRHHNPRYERIEVKSADGKGFYYSYKER